MLSLMFSSDYIQFIEQDLGETHTHARARTHTYAHNKETNWRMGSEGLGGWGGGGGNEGRIVFMFR